PPPDAILVRLAADLDFPSNDGALAPDGKTLPSVPGYPGCRRRGGMDEAPGHRSRRVGRRARGVRREEADFATRARAGGAGRHGEPPSPAPPSERAARRTTIRPATPQDAG